MLVVEINMQHKEKIKKMFNVVRTPDLAPRHINSLGESLYAKPTIKFHFKRWRNLSKRSFFTTQNKHKRKFVKERDCKREPYNNLNIKVLKFLGFSGGRKRNYNNNNIITEYLEDCGYCY